MYTIKKDGMYLEAFYIGRTVFTLVDKNKLILSLKKAEEYNKLVGGEIIKIGQPNEGK